MKNQNMNVEGFAKWLSEKVQQKKILVIQERHLPNDITYVHAMGYTLSGVNSIKFQTVSNDEIEFEVPNAEWLYNDNGVIKACWNWFGDSRFNTEYFGYSIHDLEDDQNYVG